MSTKTKSPRSTDKTVTKMLTAAEVAAMLSVREQTLAVWRSQNRVPLKWYKIGNSVRYKLSDVEDYIEAQSVTPATID